MLPIELLSERFPDRFKLRWPADNAVIEIESVIKDGVLYCRPKNAALEVLWMSAMDRTLNSQKNAVTALATAVRQKKVWRCCLFKGQALFMNHREGIIPRESNSISMGAAFHLPQLEFPNFHKPQKFLLTTPEYVEVGLSKLDAEELSDYKQAKRWVEDYKDQWSLIDASDQTKGEIKLLLQSLYWLFGAHYPTYYFGIPLLRRGGNNTVLIYSTSHGLNAPRKLLDLMNEHYQLRFINRGRVYRTGAWSHMPDSLPTFRFEPPTMHQKLEAMLLWREFLAGKLSEEEIDLYLPNKLD